MSESGFDPTAPLLPSGNLGRRRAFSRFTELGATIAAVLAVAVLAIVVFTVVARGVAALSLDFFFTGEPTGIGPAILGTGLIVLLATAIAMPIGVLVALYLTEFSGSRGTRVIQTTLDLMNGLPSIVIGLFIFALLVDHKTQSGFAGAVALAIIELPLIARGSQEILLLVPGSLREAADALGVARWRSVVGVILPSALGGIVTSTVLAVARAAGETAPLLFTATIVQDTSYDLNAPMNSLPAQIFKDVGQAQDRLVERAWGAALALVAMILVLTLIARLVQRRSSLA